MHNLGLCGFRVSLCRRNLSFEFLRFIFPTPCPLGSSFSFKESNSYTVILSAYLNYKLLKQNGYTCYLGKTFLLPSNKCVFFVSFLYCQMFSFSKNKSKKLLTFLCPSRVEETIYLRVQSRVGPQICGVYFFEKSVMIVLHLIFLSGL